MAKVEILQQKDHNFLWIDDCLWVKDIPFESKIQKEIANKCYGDVLVVRLGLGIIQRFLKNNENINRNSLVTVEKYEEVYRECKNYDIEVVGRVMLCDFYDSLFNNCFIKEKYDFIIGSDWPEIDSIYLQDYIKFKNKAKEFLKPNGQILGYGVEYFEYLIENKSIDM